MSPSFVVEPSASASAEVPTSRFLPRDGTFRVLSEVGVEYSVCFAIFTLLSVVFADFWMEDIGRTQD